MSDMKKKASSFIAVLLLISLISACGSAAGSSAAVPSANSPADKGSGAALSSIAGLPDGTWQAQPAFPDWAGYVDDTLAMNSMYSFDGVSGQGILYLTVDPGIESFDLFVNNQKIETGKAAEGIYALDIADLAVNGSNTVQVTNIVSAGSDQKVTVSIPYPEVMEGTPADVGMSEVPFELIDDIITADIDHGFTSAQLAVIKDGKLIYQNTWGQINSYLPDGTRIEDGTPADNDTLYDLASNTKMYTAAYGIQYLIDQGTLSLDDKVADIIGSRFVDNTLEIRFASFEDNYPGLKTIKKWKSEISIKNLLMHQAGFPDSGHYHNEKFDTAGQQLTYDVDNVLYVEKATKEKTLTEGICKTPLMYEPGTSTVYSDIDYMLLGLIIEKVTGKDLNTFLSETFWQPMGLTRITYCPLDNGFSKEDCAATEPAGNTRDGLIDFPGVRTETVQGEVHDEESFYMMEGMSGHAGLFSNASDLARLASVMLTGGYGNHRFFSKNTRDLFISPQAGAKPSYGIGWWREGDNNRVWYFGTQSPDSTVGHQGSTRTLTMIDPENDLVVVFLTNALNTPLLDPSSLETANTFSGTSYTTATLGFVPQILYTGLNCGGNDPKEALQSLADNMVLEKQKLVDQLEEAQGAPLSENHPAKKALAAISEAAKAFREP